MAVYRSRSFIEGISHPFISIIDKNKINNTFLNEHFVIEDGYTASGFGNSITINNNISLTIFGTFYIIQV